MLSFGGMVQTVCKKQRNADKFCKNNDEKCRMRARLACFRKGILPHKTAIGGCYRTRIGLRDGAYLRAQYGTGRFPVFLFGQTGLSRIRYGKKYRTRQ